MGNEQASDSENGWGFRGECYGRHSISREDIVWVLWMVGSERA